MFTIAWNPNGFHLIDAMPKGEKHSPRYHINNITMPFCQRLIPAGKHNSVIHPDNSRYDIAKVVLDFVWQRKVRFTPDSPDIAPSDFFFLSV
jgi:hypothetical protein